MWTCLKLASIWIFLRRAPTGMNHAAQSVSLDQVHHLQSDLSLSLYYLKHWNIRPRILSISILSWLLELVATSTPDFKMPLCLYNFSWQVHAAAAVAAATVAVCNSDCDSSWGCLESHRIQVTYEYKNFYMITYYCITTMQEQYTQVQSLTSWFTYSYIL